MKVEARCIMFAWDSVECRRYEPNKGPLDGLYEIDTDSQLANLTTGKDDYVFQWPGHERKGSHVPEPVKVSAPAAPVAEAKVDGRKGPMSEERKAKMAASLAAAREAKRVRLEAA